MGKMTNWKRRKKQEQREGFKGMVATLIPKLDDFRSRNSHVTSWDQLSEDDLANLDSNLMGAYLNNYDFEKASRHGLITKEDAAKIKDFENWNHSLGGYDD